MKPLAQFFSDPRQRNLAVLAILALLSIAAVLLTTSGEEAASTEADESPALFLPGFAEMQNRATDIRIASSVGAFHLKFQPDKGWVVPERHNYPASFEQVKRLLAALGTMQRVAAKTAQKEWLAQLELDTPGKGLSVRTSDEHGAVLADIVTGKREALNDDSGLTGLYARKAGESQSWLLRTSFVPPSDASSWLDKTVPAIAVGRIARVTFEPIAGPAFSVVRSQPTAPFALQALPPRRTLADPAAPNDLGTLLADFDFDDAIPVQEVNFDKAPRVIAHTFDGLSVAVETTRMDTYYWARITAQGKTPKAQQEARELSARTASWAYRLTADKGQQFFATLERLLVPKENKK